MPYETDGIYLGNKYYEATKAECGEGEASLGEYLVRVIDYDGTILKESWLDSGAKFTLPSKPANHSRLIFQEWSSPVEIVNDTVTVEDRDIIIGAVYTTVSGLNEFDITLTKVTGLTISFTGRDGTVYWGDGTSEEIPTGNFTVISHTYPNYGDYTIKWSGTYAKTDGLFDQYHTTNNYFCTAAYLANMRSSESSSDYLLQRCKSLKEVSISNQIKYIGQKLTMDCPMLKGLVIPTGVDTIYNYTCQNCYGLENIVIPNSVTVIRQYVFQRDENLQYVSLPNSINEIGAQTFYECSSLKRIVLPDNIIILQNFLNCENHGLKYIKLPENANEIKPSFLYRAYSLDKIFIPKNILTIGSEAFSQSAMLIYDFSQHESVPALSNANAFNSINPISKIIVPDALYDEWIAATNWLTYADYIYKASEV